VNRHRVKIDSGILAGVVVAMAGLAGLGGLLFWDTRGRGGSGLGPDFDYDVQAVTWIDPSQIGYRQVQAFGVDLVECRAIALGPDGSVYVAGDNRIVQFDQTGRAVGTFEADEPRCLAVDRDGTLYAGLRGRMAIFREGRLADQWQELGSEAVLTSIALTADDVFVADAGRRVVLRYDKQGALKDEIGRKNPARDQPGFVVPSAYFDVAVAPDGRLRIVNPGKQLIEAWTFDGQRLFWWGESGFHLRGFSGCCNPSHIAIRGDGHVITVEKGTIRIKEYDADGMLVTVVAGPEQLVAPGTVAGDLAVGFDVAVDAAGRVYVLDALQRRVRVFTRKETP